MAYTPFPTSQADLGTPNLDSADTRIPLGPQQWGLLTDEDREHEQSALDPYLAATVENLPRQTRVHTVDNKFTRVTKEARLVVDIANMVRTSGSMYELDAMEGVDLSSVEGYLQMPGFDSSPNTMQSTGQNHVHGAMIDLAMRHCPDEPFWSVGLPAVGEKINGPLTSLFLKTDRPLHFYVMRGESRYEEYKDMVSSLLKKSNNANVMNSKVSYHDGEKLDLIFVPKALNHLLVRTTVGALALHLRPTGSIVGSYPAVNRAKFMIRNRGLTSLAVSEAKYSDLLTSYYTLNDGGHKYDDPSLSIADLAVPGREFFDVSFGEAIRAKGPFGAALSNLKATPERSYIMRFYLLRPEAPSLPPLPPLSLSAWKEASDKGYNFHPTDNDQAVTLSNDELDSVCPNHYYKEKDDGSLAMIWVTPGYAYLRVFDGTDRPHYEFRDGTPPGSGGYILQVEIIGEELKLVQINKVYHPDAGTHHQPLSWLSRQMLFPEIIARWRCLVKPGLGGPVSNLPDFEDFEEGVVIVDGGSTSTNFRLSLRTQPDHQYWVGVSRHVKRRPTMDTLGPKGRTVEVDINKKWPESFIRYRPNKKPNDPLRVEKLKDAVTGVRLWAQVTSHHPASEELVPVEVPEGAKHSDFWGGPLEKPTSHNITLAEASSLAEAGAYPTVDGETDDYFPSLDPVERLNVEGEVGLLPPPMDPFPVVERVPSKVPGKARYPRNKPDKRGKKVVDGEWNVV